MTRVQDVYPDNRVSLREVGLRDGLQLVKTFPSTAAKQRWIRDEYGAGVRHFEVGSFLPAKTFPQFADVREIVATIAALPGAHGVALALNERGVNEALASGVAEIATVVSATEEHSQANANRSRESAIANVKRLCDLRDASAHKPIVNAAISMALGCSITGAVDPKEVLKLVEKCLEAGVDFVAIADTVGYAGPKQVGELTKAAVKLSGAKPVCVHLHDTRGMGIANASAALDAGARILDGSLGGLGGCPFAPGATGNVVFEDLAFLCESKGFATGIDIEKLIAVRSILRSEMPGETLYGGLARAGLPGGTAAQCTGLDQRNSADGEPIRRRWSAPRSRGVAGRDLCQRSRSTMPAAIAATNTNTSGDSVARLSRAGPGHNPTRPQPIPNRADPMTSGRSISSLVGQKFRAASSGRERPFASMNPGSRHRERRHHHDGKARVPGAEDIEKAQNLRRLHHSRNQQAGAEYQSAQQGCDHRHGSASEHVTGERDGRDGRRP